MRQETNNEMDLLLRRLGRRKDASVSGSDGHIDHLDADELSAYAENALPAAARARYTEHLAECARCRELVVQLSASVGVVKSEGPATIPGPSFLRKFLASLFSPMVLRYAVPALGLIVVAGIGFFVLRQRQGGQQSANDYVAQVQEAKAPEPEKLQQPASSPEGRLYDSTERAEANKKTDALPAESREQQAREANAAPAVSGFATEPPVTKAQPEVAKEVPKAPAPTDETRSKLEEAAKKQAEVDRLAIANERPPKAKAPEPGTKTEDRRADDSPAGRGAPARSGSETVGVASAQSAGVRQRAQRDAEEEKGKDKNDADIRTVSGRRFRKQRGIWIDTAYSSSMNVFSFTRGSEQYRTLVADEPGIKAIADQLDGEIIVVWKGRAYRIR